MEDRDRGRWGPRQSRAWAAAVGTESDALLGTMRSHWGSDMNPVMSLKALWAPLGLHRVGGPRGRGRRRQGGPEEAGVPGGGDGEAGPRGGCGEGQGTDLVTEPTGLAYAWCRGQGGP